MLRLCKRKLIKLRVEPAKKLTVVLNESFDKAINNIYVPIKTLRNTITISPTHTWSVFGVWKVKSEPGSKSIKGANFGDWSIIAANEDLKETSACNRCLRKRKASIKSQFIESPLAAFWMLRYFWKHFSFVNNMYIIGLNIKESLKEGRVLKVEASLSIVNTKKC